MTRPLAEVIAIDGPSASGKGTLARRIAGHLGFAYLDTGLLYRAVGVAVLAKGGDPADAAAASRAARALRPEDLQRGDLRSDQAAVAASKVAAIPEVRAALLSFQQGFARQPPGGAPGAVLDGRDIGTVVCPEAAVKIFVTASLPVRAERRLKELRERGLEAIHSGVLRDMQERDVRDSQRAIAPLEPARDAFVIDSSDLTPDSVFAAALAHITECRRAAGAAAAVPAGAAAGS
jgi:cytidylate kinase